LLYFLSKKGGDSTSIKKPDSRYYITAYKILIALQVRKSEVCCRWKKEIRTPWDGEPEETKTVRERVKDAVSKPPEARGKPETSAEAPKVARELG